MNSFICYCCEFCNNYLLWYGKCDFNYCWICLSNLRAERVNENEKNETFSQTVGKRNFLKGDKVKLGDFNHFNLAWHEQIHYSKKIYYHAYQVDDVLFEPELQAICKHDRCDICCIFLEIKTKQNVLQFFNITNQIFLYSKMFLEKLTNWVRAPMKLKVKRLQFVKLWRMSNDG